MSSLTDKEYSLLTISINKALNAFETPIKSKHLRAAIIGTYHSNGGHAFWAITIRQPLQDNRIVAWKFCHMFHKVLREGHHLVLQHSMRHRTMITELGKLWGHLNDGYGLCIKQYTKLLVTKLNFHDRNPRFPGNLVLSDAGELEKIASNDINVYFQLAIEMFDYLDDVIGLQATIFNSITKFGVSSMTQQGQCRLAPLIPCIQDSNQLYDFCVRLMFLLHANLPEDLLSGHRDRFRVIFKQLNNFYKQSGQLQYFINLITVPHLPTSQPNFLMQSDLGNYKAPVVVLPQEVQEDAISIVENLVDMSAPPEQHEPELPPRSQTPQAPPLPSIDFDRLLKERDEIIRHLQHDNEKQQRIARTFAYEKSEVENQMREHMAKLSSELTDAQNELSNMRFQKEELELKVQTAPVLEQKVHAEEERAKASEEKFQKLKNMYTQIREEHIKLLRTHGEVSKKLAENTKLVTEASKEKEELRCKLQEIEFEQTKVSETLQQSSEETRKNNEHLMLKIKQLEEEKLFLTDKVQVIESNKSAEIAELKINLETLQASLEELRENSGKLVDEKAKLENEYQEMIHTKTKIEEVHQQSTEETHKEREELTIKIKELEKEKCSLAEKITDIESIKCAQIEQLNANLEELKANLEEFRENCENLSEEKAKLEHEYQEEHSNKTQLEELYQQSLATIEELESVKAEKENIESERNVQIADNHSLKEQLNQRNEEYTALETRLNETLEIKTKEIEKLQQHFEEAEEHLKTLNANYDRVLIEKESFETDIQDLLHQQEQSELRNIESLAKIQQLEIDLTNSKIHGETALRALLEACIKTSEKITIRAIAESETPGASGTSTYFIMVAEELQDVLTKLKLVHENYLKDNTNNVEALARKVIVGGHLLASVHEQGMAVCNKSTNIDSGEKIANQIKDFGLSTSQLFESLHTSSKADLVQSQIDVLRDQLYKITNMIGDLTNNNDDIDKLGDLVEKELACMDKTIEEAAQKIVDMLAQSKASDSGIKLEVNEKILDACTNLMKCIQILVQKSRKVQAEIIDSGKGTATAKEFYKRNHQWTEGLISAAKSVAQGANLLVNAANKSVSGESKHTLDIVVAAQEIAACTAQLVVASRVKAPRTSQHLQELTSASKNVTQSTATVVATAKDCSQRLEETQDFDLTKLTMHQSKTMEMNIQVKVLELEQALQNERMRLAAFRRHNYQNAE